MPDLSATLTEKSLSAAISAIEIYNKPDFKYREESFAVLMTNAWELLLKAKTIRDAGESVEAIYVIDKQGVPKKTRSGNCLTHEVLYLARKLRDDPGSGFTAPCYDNIELLVEVRDNAIHLVNADAHFSRKIQEVGTAALKNYLDLATKWFGVDFRRYNFYLMPISFHHGFETAECVSLAPRSEQLTNLLKYFEATEEAHVSEDLSKHQVSIAIETKFVRAVSKDAIAVRFTNDPEAPAFHVKEEDILKSFPMRYRDLETGLRQRYSAFKADENFRKLMREVQSRGRPYCYPRYLDPAQRKGPPKWFYSPVVFEFLDKHYQPKAEGE